MIKMDKKIMNKIIQSVNASMAIEDLYASKEAREIGKLYLENRITADEAVNRIKKLHGINSL